MASETAETTARSGVLWFDSAVIATAGLVAVAVAIWVPRSEWSVLDLLFWCLLSAVLQGSSVITPGGFAMGHGYLTALISVLIFRDPLAVMLVQICGGIGETIALKRTVLRRLTFFNVSQIALAGAAGVLVLRSLSIDQQPLQMGGFPAALVATALVGLVVWLVNILLAATHLYVGYGERVSKIISQSTVYWIPSLLVAAPLALLGASLYVNPIMGGWGGWGVLALMMPVYLSRALWIQYSENEKAHADTLMTLVASLERRDPYTYGHSRRVTEIALAVGRELKLSETEVRRLRQGALLHDIGKVAVRDLVLQKPGPLNSAELDEMRAHVDLGIKLLGRSRLFQEVRPIVSSHQERWDGKGYPKGASGGRIPVLARIVAVADAYEAMTSDRAYRPAMTPEAALLSLREMAGSQLDPRIVDTFERLWSQNPPWREKRLAERETTADEAVAALLA
jgi:putative nucleotidyltransferase with HDIG domain